MTESFAELFEQSQQAISKLKPGAIVTGIVVEMWNNMIGHRIHPEWQLRRTRST